MDSNFKNSADAKTRVCEIIDDLESELLEISHAIHDEPELCYEEHRAHEILTTALINHGLKKTTSAALIVKGTTTDQEVIIGDLSNMPKIIQENKIIPPTLLIIGDVVKLHNKLKWFDPFKMHGKKNLLF